MVVIIDVNSHIFHWKMQECTVIAVDGALDASYSVLMTTNLLQKGWYFTLLK